MLRANNEVWRTSFNRLEEHAEEKTETSNRLTERELSIIVDSSEFLKLKNDALYRSGLILPDTQKEINFQAIDIEGWVENIPQEGSEIKINNINGHAETISLTGETEKFELDREPSFRSTRYCSLFKEILFHAAPLILDNIILAAGRFGESAIIKKMGSDVVEAAAYVSPVKSLSISPATATFMAIQPLISAEYAKGEYIKIGKIWQHTMLLGACISAPIMSALIPLEPLLKAAGQDARASALAAEYFHYYMFSIPASFAIDSTIQFWTSAKMQHLLIPACILRTALQLSLNLIFAYSTSLGVKGWALASMIQHWISLGILLAYMKLDKRFGKFELFSWDSQNNTFKDKMKEVLSNFKEIMKIGLPNSVILLCVFGAKIINVLLLGSSSKESLTAYYIASQYADWMIMTISPLATTGCVLISRAISTGNFNVLKGIENITLLLGITVPLFTLPFFCALQKPLTSLLLNPNGSQNEEIISRAQTIMPIVGIGATAFSIKYIATGLYRAHKETVFPMSIGILGTFIIGLGVSILLRFTSKEPSGVAIGESLGLVFTAISLLVSLKLKNKLITHTATNIDLLVQDNTRLESRRLFVNS